MKSASRFLACWDDDETFRERHGALMLTKRLQFPDQPPTSGCLLPRLRIAICLRLFLVVVLGGIFAAFTDLVPPVDATVAECLSFGDASLMMSPLSSVVLEYVVSSPRLLCQRC